MGRNPSLDLLHQLASSNALCSRKPELFAGPKKSTFNFPLLSRSYIFVMLDISFGYMGIFVVGWNFRFSTKAEQRLCRVCTLGTFLISILASVVEVAMMLLQYKRRHGVTAIAPRPDVEMIARHQGHSRAVHSHFQMFLRNLRNNTPEKDPQFDIPASSLIITTPVCVLYCIFRAFTLAEDLGSLRELPASAFELIDWSMYAPHI
jgi:hypothetical protein